MLDIFGDSLGKKGIRMVNRGPKKGIKVGFYYFELILHAIEGSSQGLTIRQLSRRLKLPYETVRYNINRLHETNRVSFKERNIFNGPPVRHYMKTPWEL